jgi:hypothetical protein
MTKQSNEAVASERSNAADPHVDEKSGARVPAPDPKDQTGDPDADNPAMQELRKRQAPGSVSGS